MSVFNSSFLLYKLIFGKHKQLHGLKEVSDHVKQKHIACYSVFEKKTLKRTYYPSLLVHNIFRDFLFFKVNK